MIGLVYYSDDPHKRVFRVVYPEFSDSELDQPPTDGNRKPILDANGQPYSWTSLGVLPRPVAMDKVANASGRKRGAVQTAATEPMIYTINVDPVLATLTDAQLVTYENWLAAHPEWTCYVDLGVGDPATLAANIISPSWIVVVDGNPGIGTLQRSTQVLGHTVSLWVV